MKTIQELENIATQVRRDIIRMVADASSGHPGGSLGCADLLVVLYFHSMKYKTAFTMEGKDEDIFYLSNGHISPLFYSVLARSGFFDIKELSSFRKINSRLQGHPTNHTKLPGVRISSGSLGQGLSVAAGHAIVKKMQNDTKRVFALMGDGELQEGQNWEAFMFAAHKKLGNLTAFIDANGQQIDGSLEQVLSLGNLENKLSAFGWEVLSIDGHSIPSIIDAVDTAKKIGEEKQKPVAIIAKTIMGKGVDFMENNHNWHGTAPNAEQKEKALAQLVVSDATLRDY